MHYVHVRVYIVSIAHADHKHDHDTRTAYVRVVHVIICTKLNTLMNTRTCTHAYVHLSCARWRLRA